MATTLPANIEASLASPCHAAALEDGRCSECQQNFDQVHGQRVLVDFGQSVLERDAVLNSSAASPIERSGRGRFARFFDAPNPVAERNVAKMLDLLPKEAVVLCVGGATVGKGTEALYASREVVSFDIYASDHTHLIADAHQIPFLDSTFDAVVVQAVLEHVLDPQQVVDEIWRVLKPEGIVYAETPFLQHVHEGPYDFTRFTDSGHRWLFRRFSAVDSGVVAGPGYQLLWSVDYAIRAAFGSRRAGLRARKFVTPLRALDRWSKRPFAVDAASAVFFLGRRADEPISPKEIVAYYQGAQ